MTRQPTPDVLGQVLGPVDDTKLIRAELRYDYSLIPAEQRDAVQAAAVDIVRAGRRAQEDLLKIGQLLIDVKDRLEHGQFQEWCEAEFQMSARTARNMMNVAKVFGDKTETVSVLSDSAMYLLAAPSTPEEARVEVIEQAQATGKSPTKAEVQETIRKHQPEQRYVEVWKLESKAAELARDWDTDPAMMRESARQRIGSYWGELNQRVAKEFTYPYRISDLRQAINNVAGRMEELSKRAAEVAKQDAEKQPAGRPMMEVIKTDEEEEQDALAADIASRNAAADEAARQAAADPYRYDQPGAIVNDLAAQEAQRVAQEAAAADKNATSLRSWWRCLRCGHERQWVIPGTCSKCNGGSWTHIEAPVMDHQAAVLTPDREARAVATADAAFRMAKAPTRNERIDALLHIFQGAVDALPEVGELTGHYSATTALLRELNKTMQVLKDNKIGGYKANG